ncbi:MAG: EamA family transporter [Acidimicrobiia bacterium]|nr:EamA family transporter [Acidimicrobiia bacterium]
MDDSGGAVARWAGGTMFGLLTALCWSLSPVFVRRGLEEVPFPVVGVAIGMTASTLAYLPVVWMRRGKLGLATANRGDLGLQVFAGLLTGFSIAANWIAVSLITVAAVLSIGRLAVIVVLILSPIVIGQHLERVTPRIWLGGLFIVGGSILLAFYG